MKITDIEKIILINQYKILSKLYPEDTNFYETNIKILESGYTLHYTDLTYCIDHTEMTEDECKEVLAILDIYRLLSFSVDDLGESGDVDFTGKKIFFPGFDGNYEANYLSYTKFFLHTLDRFQELHHTGSFPDYNTHCPVLDQYRKMLEKAKTYGKPLSHLSKTQINELLALAPCSLIEKRKTIQ